MRLEVKYPDTNEICLIFHLEDDDIPKPSEKFSIGEKSTKIKVNFHNISEVHVDLITLSSILICNPFVGKRLSLPFNPSQKFMEAANGTLSRYKLFAKEDLPPSPPRESMGNGRPGLAFSGGVDSTAALSVMPGSTIPIFMDRPIRKGSLYNPEAAHRSCKLLTELGYDVHRVECDLEYVRDPVGFPTDVANAVPAILLSEELGLSSISFGTVLESAFGTGHEHYRNYTEGSHWNFFGTLFQAAGIQMSLPIAGVSEVGTSIIAHRSPVGMAAQSCIRGTWGSPCMSCWKCFRKGLLSLALGQIKYEKKEFDKLLKSNEVRKKLSELPISHEDVIAYSIHRIDRSQRAEFEILGDRVEGLGRLNLLSKWYSPSDGLIPDNWRHSCREKILRYLRKMNFREERIIEEWDMDEFLLSERATKGQKNLISVFS